MKALTSTLFKRITNFSLALVIAISTVSFAAPTFFGESSVSASTVNVTTADDVQLKIDTATAGDELVFAAGTYNVSNVNINKSLTLVGMTGAHLVVNPAVNTSVNALNITANDVSVNGFEISGEVTGTYVTYPWLPTTVSRGITVSQNITGFSITNNNIHNVRNGVLIDGRNSTGTLSNNVIENTKGAVSIQYTNASALTVEGNSQGAIGNAWGFNLHLNGNFDFDGTLHSPSPFPGGIAPTAVQSAILALKNANGGLTVQDQGYQKANRTDVNVATSGTTTGQGDLLGKISTVQLGLDAIVAGGNVFVANGSYLESIETKVSGTHLIGESKANVVITSAGLTSTGHAVSIENVNDVTFRNLSFVIGTTSNPGYALKAYNTANLTLDNLDFTGRTLVPGKPVGGVDLNAVDGATISNVTAKNFNKNGFAVSAKFVTGNQASRNITFNNISSTNNAWAGIAFYNSNNNNIGAVLSDITGITFAGTTTVSNNLKGLEIVGDTDANVSLGNVTPAYTVTGLSGATLNLGSAIFTGNVVNVINYQTKNVLATDTSFDGKKGSDMTDAERTTFRTGTTVIDVNDKAFLGEVIFYIAPVVVVPPATGGSSDDTTGTGNSVTTIVTPIITNPASVLGTSDNTADNGSTDVEGTTDDKTATAKDDLSGVILGLAWYWWILILAGATGLTWWIIAAYRRRNTEE